MGLSRVFPKTSVTKPHKCKDKRRDSLAYWESRLKRMGLGPDAGCENWLYYGHAVADLDFDGRHTFKPLGESRESDEWPISL